MHWCSACLHSHPTATRVRISWRVKKKRKKSAVIYSMAARLTGATAVFVSKPKPAVGECVLLWRQLISRSLWDNIIVWRDIKDLTAKTPHLPQLRTIMLFSASLNLRWWSHCCHLENFKILPSGHATQGSREKIIWKEAGIGATMSEEGTRTCMFKLDRDSMMNRTWKWRSGVNYSGVGLLLVSCSTLCPQWARNYCCR